jgi:hypothetical protein
MRLVRIALAVIGPALGLTACSDNGTTAPDGDTTLEAVTPSTRASGVDAAGPITVRFSGPMSTGMEQYVDLHRDDIGGPVVHMSCAWSDDRTTLTCTPGMPLQPGTSYTFHLGSGMMDASGRSVETEEHGLQMGGQPVTGQMMGGMHGGQAPSMMGPGWRHAGDDHVGMGFTFEAGQTAT